MKDILNILKRRHDLSPFDIKVSFDAMFAGNAPSEHIGAFLMGLAQKGETSEEIAAAAAYLRAHVAAIRAPDNAIDCCGTGGDVSGTYNISTAVALICAACGVPIAKHGNRAASSKSGAADVLEALGVNIDAPKENLEAALQQYNFAFLMAPKHHQILKPIVPIRKSLGFPTIFNLLGPLANPAGTKTQLIGVFDKKWLRPMAEALKILGSQRAWIVHGRDGLDEITLTDETDAVALEPDGSIREFVISPKEAGLELCDPQDLKGGSANENARALSDLLDAKPSAYRDIALLNAAAVLVLFGSCQNLTDGVRIASEAIASKRVKANFEAYKLFVGGTNE